MSHPPYCIACISNEHISYGKSSKSPLQWNNDFSTEDYGYEFDGVISVYSCPHENCNAHYDIINFYTNDNEAVKVIKYCYLSDENIYINNKKEMISHCLYCANELVKISHTSNSKIKTPLYSEFDGTKTVLKCSNCNTEYEVIDSPSLEDDIYLYRDIFIK